MKLQVVILSSAIVGVCLSYPQRSQLYQTPEIRAPSQLYETPTVETSPRPTIRTSTSTSTTTKGRPDEDPDPSDIDPSIIGLPSDQTDPPPMMGMPYSFTWDVEDNESSNLFSHVESSDGQRMEGEYKVMLPDGRMQFVRSPPYIPDYCIDKAVVSSQSECVKNSNMYLAAFPVDLEPRVYGCTMYKNNNCQIMKKLVVKYFDDGNGLNAEVNYIR